MNPGEIDTSAVKKALERVAGTYDNASGVQKNIADRLLERLDLMRITPEVILDVGARTGYTTRRLKKRYKKARVIGFDRSPALLKQSKQGFLGRHPNRVCGEDTALPFSDHSVDLIFSNAVLQGSLDIEKAVREFQRVLKPNGLLLFSALGPDTLKELRDSFAQAHTHPHVHLFMDMHDIGDILMAHRFSDPVVDMEHVTIRYQSLDRLWKDLKLTGASNALTSRSKGLMGKHAWQRMLAHYRSLKGERAEFPATIELIYGHGWGTELKSPASLDSQKEVLIPVDTIQKREN